MMIAVRLAGFYVGSFAVIGIAVPFWPLWLASKGLAPDEIGTVIAVSILTRATMASVVTRLVDALGERRRPMIALSAASLGGFLLFGLTDGLWSILGVTLIYASMMAPLHPLIESLTVQIAQDRGFDYGRVRLWGSVAFIISALAVGRILVGSEASIIFWLMTLSLAATFITSLFLPDSRPSPGAPMRGLELLTTPKFVLLLAATAFIQASHSVYYSFGTIAWQAAGYSEDAIGALWAEGVVAEVILFAYGRAILKRVGALPLIVLGGIGGVLRWTGTGLTDAAVVLVVVQALHALTFGAAHLGAVQLIARTVPPQLATTAQGLYVAMTGIGLGIGAYASGKLYAAFQVRSYLVMAVVAAIGLGLALVLARTTKKDET
ncbi:MAG: 3-phenylpropionate MFS transporter [Rhodospirillales bacterium]|nr:3-phenylpropionate MFS transporter [Rhodospirillales bacterium]